MKLGEIAVNDCITKLRAGVPGRIAAINVEMDDGLAMNAPADTDYFGGRKVDFPNTPSIFVMEGPTTFTQEGPHGLLSDIQILVYVFEAGQDGDQLRKRLQRLARAVIECLYDDEPKERTANGFNLAPVKTVPGQAFIPTSEHTWRGYYTVFFKVKQLEL